MLKVKVAFYAGFRELFGDRGREVELPDGVNIQGLLGLLCDSDEQRHRILDDSGSFRNYVNIILKNDHNVRSIREAKTELRDGDSVFIFPSIGDG